MSREIKAKITRIDLKTKVNILREVEQIEDNGFGGQTKCNHTKKYKIKLSILFSN